MSFLGFKDNMTQAEAKRLVQNRAHAEAEAAVKQAQKAYDATFYALTAFQVKHGPRQTDLELQAALLQLTAARQAARDALDAAQARKDMVLATVPKRYLVKRWYEPPEVEDEESSPPLT